jgi:uncharacterized protein (DUF1697 family)
MPTYIALLRAVNVGGTGKLPMADFRKVLEDLGFYNVQTYIQSGNAVFDAAESRSKSGSKSQPNPNSEPSSASNSAAKVTESIALALEKLLGAPVGVIVRTHDQLTRTISGNPFAAESAANGALVHAAFLAGPAAQQARAALEAIAARYPTRRDRYHLDGDTIYFHFPDGAGETKFTGKTLDKAIGVIGTARNWNTVLKLHEMSKPK